MSTECFTQRMQNSAKAAHLYIDVYSCSLFNMVSSKSYNHVKRHKVDNGQLAERFVIVYFIVYL